MFITGAKELAKWFHRKYLGIYCKINAEDRKIMTSCGLICRYHGYSASQDGETVRSILIIRANAVKGEWKAGGKGRKG